MFEYHRLNLLLVENYNVTSTNRCTTQCNVYMCVRVYARVCVFVCVRMCMYKYITYANTISSLDVYNTSVQCSEWYCVGRVLVHIDVYVVLCARIPGVVSVFQSARTN